jgi:hypothetical protein
LEKGIERVEGKAERCGEMLKFSLFPLSLCLEIMKSVQGATTVAFFLFFVLLSNASAERPSVGAIRWDAW